jgi:hypothetical protein
MAIRPLPTSPIVQFLPDAQSGVWNHFGRMGTIDENGNPARYDYAFIYILSTSANLDVNDKSSRLILPVNPEELIVPRQRSSSAVDVVGGQQRSQMGTTQLRTLSISGLFPAAYEADYCVGKSLDRTPAENRAWIESTFTLDSLKTKPIYLFVKPEAAPLDGSSAYVESMTCFVTGFAVAHRAGHPLDLFYEIELTEYVPQDLLSQAFSRRQPPKTPKAGTQMTVGQASKMSQVATKVYGPGWGAVGGKWLIKTNPKLKQINGNKLTLVSQKMAKNQVITLSPLSVNLGRPDIANLSS